MSPPSTRNKRRVAGHDGVRAVAANYQKVTHLDAREALLARLRVTPLATEGFQGQHAAPYHGDAGPYFHWVDEQSGYPETLRRLRAYPTEKLLKESRETIGATASLTFGLNATKWKFLVDAVIAERQTITADHR